MTPPERTLAAPTDERTTPFDEETAALHKDPPTEPPQGREPLDLKTIAANSLNGHSHDVQVIGPYEDIETDRQSSPFGMLEGFANDLIHSPKVLPAILQHHLQNAVNRLLGKNGAPKPDEPAVLMMPGYFGPNGYLANLAKKLEWPAIWHPAFDTLRMDKKIPDNAAQLVDILKPREAPTIGIAHSKGGPTVAHALKTLQDLGLDGLVDALIMISPVTLGVRPEITPIAQRIPSETIRSMVAGRPEVSGWEDLTERNRRKIITVTAINGDQFTAKEQATIPGSTIMLAPASQGHLRQCVDKRSTIFQVVVSLANTIAKEIERTGSGSFANQVVN